MSRVYSTTSKDQLSQPNSKKPAAAVRSAKILKLMDSLAKKADLEKQASEKPCSEHTATQMAPVSKEVLNKMAEIQKRNMLGSQKGD